MVRTQLERINNPSGHHYQRDGSIYVCAICGAAEHYSGNYWWAGRYSKSEPPCANNSAGQCDWHSAANETYPMIKDKNSPRLQLGYSPLTKTIKLAKMRDTGPGQRLRVGNDPGRDVTNEAAQLVWQLVIDEGGEIGWELDDGTRMILKAEKVAPAVAIAGGES